MMQYKIINIKGISDDRGSLAVLENHDLPFKIKRVFWIKGVNSNAVRGNHAHYKTKLCLVCINGQCKINLDDATKKIDLSLRNNQGLILQPHFWHTISEFSDDCILLVLASEEYDEKDYIRDYSKFKEVYNK